MHDFTQDLQPDQPDETSGPSAGAMRGLGGRRKHAIDLENRPTRLLSDHVEVKALLGEAQKLALARSVQDTLELTVRALERHTRSRWAVAWRMTEAGTERLQALNRIDQLPALGVALMDKYEDICNWDEGAYEDAPLVAVPIRKGNKVVGGVAIQMQDTAVSEDELTTLEFLATFCAVGEAHGQMLTQEERQKEQAQIAKQNQSDFLSMVSHDVRGPLSVIRGYSQMLRTSRSAMDESKQDELLGKVVEQAERIERLVNGILDVARSETGKLALAVEETDVVEVIKRALSLVDTQGQYQVVAPAGPVVAQIDRLRVEQIIANLVGNALKYGEAPFVIKIAPGQGAAGADYWHLAVVDGGEGLSQEVEDNLFQKFVPGAKNVGLGLSIVQAFVHAHGGQITYARTERSGVRESAFYIRMPRKLAADSRSK